MKVNTTRILQGKKVERGCLGKEGVDRKEGGTEGFQETSGFVSGFEILLKQILDFKKNTKNRLTRFQGQSKGTEA